MSIVRMGTQLNQGEGDMDSDVVEIWMKQNVLLIVLQKL